MPKLTIDGTEIEVPAGTSIIQACETMGIEIPRFCYHDRLSVPANCRMCLVEVAPGPPKPQASCALACADGMTVKTDSEMVKKARKGVMEMLLINHPLDCPICDQGGECDLQDQAMAYGFDRSRYHESKRAVKDKELGPLVKTVMTRCIQCTRCVRFGEEVAGTPALGLLNRGEDVEIGTFVEKMVSSELSGNLVDVCPVGALTSKPYAFTARPWELRKTESIDVHDAVGSNIRIDARGNEVMRILPRLNEDVNEEWINDRSRYAVDGLKRQRLDRPYVRNAQGRLEPVSWAHALGVVAERLANTRPDWRVALAGDLCDVESMVALKDLMNGTGGAWLECRTDGAFYDPTYRAGYIFNTGIANIEKADAILLVGTNPRHEATLVNARIRKTWLNKRVKVGVIGEAADLTYPYIHIGNTAQALQTLLKDNHPFAKTLASAQFPMVIVGTGAFQRDDGFAVQMLVRELAEHFNMIRPEWNGYNVLHNAAARVGALDIGFWSRESFDLGKADFIYLLGVDSEVVSYISPKAFVVYQGHHGDAGAARADVILPGAAYTEKGGLYVNTEGRVQVALKAIDPPGQAQEDWTILHQLAALCGKPLSYADLYQLRARIIEEWPHMEKVGEVVPAPWGVFGKSGAAVTEAFRLPVANFYMTNVICRASPTMAECTRAFVEGAMAQAAE